MNISSSLRPKLIGGRKSTGKGRSSNIKSPIQFRRADGTWLGRVFKHDQEDLIHRKGKVGSVPEKRYWDTLYHDNDEGGISPVYRVNRHEPKGPIRTTGGFR